MSDGQLCGCIHGCRQYAVRGGICPGCAAGWHGDVCPHFEVELHNPRLKGVPLTVGGTAYCGTCGAQPPQHPKVAK